MQHTLQHDFDRTRARTSPALSLLSADILRPCCSTSGSAIMKLMLGTHTKHVNVIMYVAQLLLRYL